MLQNRNVQSTYINKKWGRVLRGKRMLILKKKKTITTCQSILITSLRLNAFNNIKTDNRLIKGLVFKSMDFIPY